jgi:hypothetical protein
MGWEEQVDMEVLVVLVVQAETVEQQVKPATVDKVEMAVVLLFFLQEVFFNLEDKPIFPHLLPAMEVLLFLPMRVQQV